MNDSIYQEIEDNPRFQELVKKRSRFAWLLSLITLTMYVGFIFLIAFEPQWLGTPIYTGSSVTRGIPVGVGLIVTSFILTGIYVIRANGEFDRLTAEIIREVKQ
ncbi:hypothetical protein B7R74_21170 [Yersinia pseudotuberculosis]|uniref:Membrane protein n=3 Tax=Yersinia pseudotuberculosis complex TaxID=1649845 RepID=A0A0T9R3T9_9GAMM|nr:MULTISPECIES: DUF485 domain-containing protein [Yersinia pseudotuberculosis complex]AHK19534.1 membrane protein [Yersinia similis]PSH11688.1 hypothetical protein B7R74_21170 [Yersinia pseudotuberculosis]CFQ67188.1 inner membrane protein involved in acetate transport [Yersinia similis]CNC49315.1 inner membrane protein involved in acetate transport [Yersinia similis]CNC85913.1 inner membrane protein involved in acetate transport [Yersinia pseudotuberculosis]